MDNFDIYNWRQKLLLNEAEFDPKKSDLNKDRKLSNYEKTRGMAIAKNMDEAVPFKKNALGEQPAYMPHDPEYLEEHDWMTDMNDEVSMVRTQLKQIIENATKLMQMTQNGEQYDSWVQAKITKAADYLESVYNYQSTEQ
jgi:hypothetical protein